MLISRAALSRLCTRSRSVQKQISVRCLTTATNTKKKPYKNNINIFSTSCERQKNLHKSFSTSIHRKNKEQDSFTTSRHEDPIVDAINSANELKKGGQYDLAIRLYSEVLNEQPNNGEALINRGECLLLADKPALALPDLEKALGINRMNAPLLLMIGRCYEGLKDIKKALKQYEQALFINDKFSEAYVTRANLYSKIGDMNRCIEDYKEAMKVDSNPRIRLLLADVYLRAYNIDAAKSLYTEILNAQNKEHVKEAYAGLGIINYITDDFPKAIIDFSNALKLDPENTDLLSKRANCYLSIGNWDRALQDTEKAISLKKDMHLAYLTRAQCYFHNRDYLKAAYDFSFYLDKEEEEFKKLDAAAPSVDNATAHEEQKFDVLVNKAMCYWYKDVSQRGYDPEGDFGSHTQANWKSESGKEISAARLIAAKELLNQIKDGNLLELAMKDYLLANKNPGYREKLLQHFNQFMYVLETVYRRPKKPAKHVNIKSK